MREDLSILSRRVRSRRVSHIKPHPDTSGGFEEYWMTTKEGAKMTNLESQREPYPLFNTTFTLHRLSPLYTSTTLPLNTAVLQHHAHRFREILVGDVLRGVRIGLGNDAITAAGGLNKVTWRLLSEEDAWDKAQGDEETRLEETTVTIDSSRGILVTVAYEKMTYTAILLKMEDVVSEAGFQHFPLLLTKMPASLKETFLAYLSSTFDTRVSAIHLSSKQVIGVFETYLSDVCTGVDGVELESGERIRVLRNVVKETEVFVGFDMLTDSGALKTIEIHLLREDVPKLLATGRPMAVDGASTPFMNALSVYMQAHLALDLKHEQVKIVRIACGAFVLGAEGKVKLSEPVGSEEHLHQQSFATTALVEGLVKVAAGGELLMKGA